MKANDNGLLQADFTGGVHNALLMQSLRELLHCPVMSTAEAGVDPDFVEAMAFAWLAKKCLGSDEETRADDHDVRRSHTTARLK